MSLRIGMILPKDIREDTLDKLRKKYNLGLIRFNNKYIQKQTKESEQFFQFSQYGDDSYYGIGAYDIYTKNLDPIYNDKTLSEEKKKLFLDDINRSRALYKKTAKEIINIIKEILSQENINKIGIIYFDGYTSTDEVKFGKLKKLTWNINNIDEETIMKLEEDTINYFQYGEVVKCDNNFQEEVMNVIKLEEEPKGEIYKKLIEYACETNDTLKFKGPSISLYKEYVEERFEEICKILNRNKEEIIDNYDDEEFMDELYKEADLKLKDEKNMIWSKELEEWIEKMAKDGESKEHIEWITSNYESNCFSYIIMLGVFNRNFNILKQKAKENLIISATSNTEYSMSTVKNYYVRYRI